jgi:WD40 repeat protein
MSARLWWLVTLVSVLLFHAAGAGQSTVGSPEPLPVGAKMRLGSISYRIPRGLYYADISADGRRLGYVDVWNQLKFVEVATGVVKPGPRLQVQPQAQLKMAPTGQRCATGDGSNITVWNPSTGQRIAVVAVAGSPNPRMWAPLAFSADGQRLAVGWGNKDADMIYVVWDVDSHRAIQQFTTPALDHPLLALSPDGRWLVTWGYREVKDNSKSSADAEAADDPNRTITVWKVDTGKAVQRIRYPGPVGGRRVCFSPDSQRLAIVGRDIELWDTTGWQWRVQVSGSGW